MEGRGSLGPPVDTAERDVRRKCRFARGRGRTGVAPFFSLRLGNSFVEIGQSLNFYQLLSSIENNNNNFDYSSIELKLVRISI